MPLVSSRPAPAVLQLLLDLPATRNALTRELASALQDAVDTAAWAVPDVRAIVLGSSTAGAFCSGVSLVIDDAGRQALSDQLYRLYASMLECPVPVVAAVSGPAVGGGAQLALAADVCVMSPQAFVRFAGPGHGLAVGAWALPGAVGRGRALEMMLSQRDIGGEEAVRTGLAQQLDDAPLEAATALAVSVSNLDRDAVTRAKRLVVAGERLHERLAEERAGNSAFTGAVRGIARLRNGPSDAG